MSYFQPSNHPPPPPPFQTLCFIDTMQHLFSENTANSIGTSMPLNPLNLYLSTGCLIKARRSVAGYLTNQKCPISSFLFRRAKRIAQKIVHLRNILFLLSKCLTVILRLMTKAFFEHIYRHISIPPPTGVRGYLSVMKNPLFLVGESLIRRLRLFRQPTIFMLYPECCATPAGIPHVPVLFPKDK